MDDSIFFFFSSRRRHTRYWRDWSSDVCSSDLPPALTVTRDGEDLRLTGRFPTYTRPIGTAPAYTGRVYDLAVTVSPAGAVRDGPAPAEGPVFLGTDRAESMDEPGLHVIRHTG